jgi:phosphoglycolate phosphatase
MRIRGAGALTRMSRRFDLLVFDWDGTVVDSAGHITDCIQAAARDVELAAPSDERVRHIIGLGLADALAYLFPELPHTDYPLLVERYRFHYLAGGHKVTLFEGAFDGIQAFRAAGFTLAVATGKSRQGLDRALQDSGLGPFFHASRCADEGLPKPHPDMLLYLVDTLRVDAQRALMVGDTTHDLEMARAAGIPAVAVAYGAHPRASLDAQKPLACVSSFHELTRWMKENA